MTIVNFNLKERYDFVLNDHFWGNNTAKTTSYITNFTTEPQKRLNFKKLQFFFKYSIFCNNF